MIWLIALVCSKQPENPGTPFCTDVSMYRFAVRNVAMRLGSTAKNSFPSTFSKEIVRNSITRFDPITLGVNISAACCQHSGTLPFLHITLRRLHSVRRSFEHILYTLYGLPFGPRADPVLALLTTSIISFNVGSMTFSGAVSSDTGSILGQFPNGSFLNGSECVSFMYC